MIRFTKNKTLLGTFTVDPKNNKSMIVGTSTYLLSNTANLDLIVIASDSPSRMQVKEILNVNSETILTLESNTKFFGDGYINIANGSNVITVTQNTYTVNLIANDIITYEYLNQNVESMIMGGSGKTYTLNTISSYFTSNANLKNYFVYPYFDNVQYDIIRTYYNDAQSGNPDVLFLSGTSGLPNYSTYEGVTGTVTVSWKFVPNGATTYIVNGVETQWNPGPTRTWCDDTPVNSYWIRGTYDSGTPPNGGNSLDVWYKISGNDSTDVQYEWSSGGNLTGSIKIEISADESGSIILATGYYGGDISL